MLSTSYELHISFDQTSEPIMKSNEVIVTPKLLGYLGLIPFILSTGLLFFDRHNSDMWQHFLLSYGAVILTFVGALHWSFAMALPGLSIKQQRVSFIWSVIPSLIAWVSLSIPPVQAFIIISVFFGTALLRDKQLSFYADLPEWYMPLRINLTTVAMLCLITAAYVTYATAI